MAIDLKPVNLVVAELGAAGGVAILPLAKAGLKLAGIEARNPTLEHLARNWKTIAE